MTELILNINDNYAYFSIMDLDNSKKYKLYQIPNDELIYHNDLDIVDIKYDVEYGTYDDNIIVGVYNELLFIIKHYKRTTYWPCEIRIVNTKDINIKDININYCDSNLNYIEQL